MSIDFKFEINEFITRLNKAKGYSSIEKIIANNIKTHIDKNEDDESILKFLEATSGFITYKIKKNQQDINLMSYTHARDFINTLLEMPYCRHWIKTIAG
jgi:hypothetical protein